MTKKIDQEAKERKVGPKQQIYDDEILPHLQRIHEICKDHRIGMFAAFGLDQKENHVIWSSSAYSGIPSEEIETASSINDLNKYEYEVMLELEKYMRIFKDDYVPVPKHIVEMAVMIDSANKMMQTVQGGYPVEGCNCKDCRNKRESEEQGLTVFQTDKKIEA